MWHNRAMSPLSKKDAFCSRQQLEATKLHRLNAMFAEVLPANRRIHFLPETERGVTKSMFGFTRQVAPVAIRFRSGTQKMIGIGGWHAGSQFTHEQNSSPVNQSLSRLPSVHTSAFGVLSKVQWQVAGARSLQEDCRVLLAWNF